MFQLDEAALRNSEFDFDKGSKYAVSGNALFFLQNIKSTVIALPGLMAAYHYSDLVDMAGEFLGMPAVKVGYEVFNVGDRKNLGFALQLDFDPNEYVRFAEKFPGDLSYFLPPSSSDNHARIRLESLADSYFELYDHQSWWRALKEVIEESDRSEMHMDSEDRMFVVEQVVEKLDASRTIFDYTRGLEIADSIYEGRALESVQELMRIASGNGTRKAYLVGEYMTLIRAWDEEMYEDIPEVKQRIAQIREE